MIEVFLKNVISKDLGKNSPIPNSQLFLNLPFKKK
jgi:hypothetical protein